ncbi:DUF2975 domain-containing protein [Aquimarina gracilis]|uniref:DUF2975 domain-containing protein n=1 Tax=Aquimarina gracilis TaxID=874422 RepID=A0ABU5ZXU6_9FLAO|nr:DUF2975 domain-containing protein [Aquimarina gracilis]MEB3346683.1 DUF2975 domain-containing protein [Aquimarina gracilis]
MKNKTKQIDKGIKAFNTIYIIGIIFVLMKLIDYLQWTFQLIKKWSLPDEPFFSKVNLTNSNVEISISTYLTFAIAYIIVFGFIILGLHQLNRTTKLFAENKIFQQEVSLAFKKAGKLFLAFAFGTLIIDIAFLAWAQTSSRVIDLLSTELIVFLILGYLMFFLSDVFKEGISIREENELTI